MGVDVYDYQLPENFEDEEIDEDEAFNSEDEAKYGEAFEQGYQSGGHESDDSSSEPDQDAGEAYGHWRHVTRSTRKQIDTRRWQIGQYSDLMSLMTPPKKRILSTSNFIFPGCSGRVAKQKEPEWSPCR